MWGGGSLRRSTTGLDNSCQFQPLLQQLCPIFSMSHPVAYSIAAVALGVLTLGAASTGGVSTASSVTIAIAAISVAVIGVPHGGLDHWVGRRLLADRVGSRWSILFFTIYLFAGMMVAAAWYVAPGQTLVLFFLVSAWHFGREDGLNHFEAIAAGGLIIWIPALSRPAEMEMILQSLIINDSAGAATRVVVMTQWIASVLIPVAIWSLLWGASRKHTLATISTMIVAAIAPILWSFTLFFCGWHSIRGLARMRNEENLSWRTFIVAVAPLSIAAVVIVVGVGAYMGESLAEPTEQMRMMFIGLASIAVPHLFPHEFENILTSTRSVQTPGEVLHVG